MLSSYHISKQNRSLEESQRLLKEKEEELSSIIELGRFKTSQTCKIAVLGCADRRHVQGHRKIFSNLLGHDVVVNTFDITTQHLIGEENVYEQDVADAIPYGPYDIVFSDVLLKFVPKERQMDVIDNSVNVLKSGGIAIHRVNLGDRFKKNDVSGNEVVGYLSRKGIKARSVQINRGDVVIIEKA